MCNSTITEKYRQLLNLPPHLLSYSDILFLTAHRHCCGKKQK